MVAQKRVVPVILAASEPKKWLKPFDVLEPLEGVGIDSGDRRAFPGASPTSAAG